MTDLRKAAEQALEVIELAMRSHSMLLLSDPPQEAWKVYGVEQKARETVSALRAALEQEKKWNLIAEMHNVEQDSLVPKDFNDWWHADQLTQTNPFREDSPAYWAFEGWCARDVETKRLGKLCDDFIGQMMVLRAEKQLREAISKLKDKP